ncbi:DUF3606 domain-containing protein [Muricoccus radiodurans]|uniref:DUF3606 domain-containing protein n=1 Tax=Muricoccus radiodurans TaxID=2231721 RepID=UPI003CEFD352
MLLDKPESARIDDQRIDLRDPYSVRHWSRAFGLSELDLAIAVQTAGPRPGAVAFLLKRQPTLEARQA